MTAEWLTAALRHDRAVVLGGLAFVALLAWAYLLLGTGVEMPMMDMGGGRMMAMPPQWTPGYAFVIFVMWSVMMVAMMLPSAAPVTLLVAGIARKRGAGQAGTVLFVAGYIAAWVGFAGAATLLQWGLSEAGVLSPTMALADLLVAGMVLVAAGIYEWTPLKETCLRHCRSPLEFLLFHWRDGGAGALMSGVRHGAFCLGCCWMLMALLFVGGIMNLAWIAGIALLVLVEKALPWGGRMGRVAGVVLAGWGVLAVAMAL